MIIRRKGDPWLVQKRVTPITREAREFWKVGHGTLMSMVKAVRAVAGEVAKHEGVDQDAAMRVVHAGLSPIYRAVKRLMDQAVTPAQVDEDEELKRLREQIDPAANGGVQPPAPGNAAPLDEDPTDHVGNPRKGPRIDMSRLAPHSKRGVMLDNRRVR